MRCPNFREEKKLWRKGFKLVAGLDEAGRGPLAGPVTACAVALLKYPKSKNQIPQKIKDSKKLSSKKREEFHKILTNHPRIRWGIGRVSEKVIDRINILEATKLAMQRALQNLNYKLENKNCQADFLILDGNFRIKTDVPQKSIIKADEKVFSCAAASIIAKVTRDRMMMKYHKKYSQYGFDKHKGYPTKLHRKMLKRYGPSLIHRRTFQPVKNLS